MLAKIEASPRVEKNSVGKSDPDLLLMVCWYILSVLCHFQVIHRNSTWPLCRRPRQTKWFYLIARPWLPIISTMAYHSNTIAVCSAMVLPRCTWKIVSAATEASPSGENNINQKPDSDFPLVICWHGTPLYWTISQLFALFHPLFTCVTWFQALDGVTKRKWHHQLVAWLQFLVSVYYV